LHRYFNAPERDRLFLDFVTRTQATPLAEEEFGLLMATYSRSKVAFCYEPSGIKRFRGRSSLTGRWVHAWAAGCTVIGKAPTLPAVAEQMDWPEAAIDLPPETEASIKLIEAILDDTEGLARRRRRNVAEALRRYDTRLRLRDMLKLVETPIPEALSDGLNQLETVARAISAAD
jgi:hypothetical protein